MGALVVAFGASIALTGCTARVRQRDAEGFYGPHPYIVVLGIAQDGGYPQAGCHKECCAPAWSDQSIRRHVVCLAIVDPESGARWMIEATPDFREQRHMIDEVAPHEGTSPGLHGIFLTHAHIGHYTGLMHLGHEAMGAKRVPVYAMPRMCEFLRTNGPWDQLVGYENITVHEIEADKRVQLNARISITPFRVPHREEYSEVVGYRIDGPDRSVIFIPDIDKWERWDRRIEDVIADVEVAYLDGTFFAEGELPDRDMAEIPHPFVVESMKRFRALPVEQRAKLRFIHMNHTNPLLRSTSGARQAVEEAGFRVAEELERAPL